jgi:hypothetical protein
MSLTYKELHYNNSMNKKLSAYTSKKNNNNLGDVATSPAFAKQLVYTCIPEEKFESDSTTFLDAFCGQGSFVVSIIIRLLEHGHSRENISSRIYCGDIRKGYYNRIKRRVKKMFDIDLVNAYHGDSLTKKWNMKFDVLLGNPPYQDEIKQGNLWFKFLMKGTEISDYILLITPTSIFSCGGFGTKRHKISNIINAGFNFDHINPDVNEHFNVGIDICSYAISRGSNGIAKLPSGETITITADVPPPFVLSPLHDSIIKKTYRNGGGWPGFKDGPYERNGGTPDSTSVRVNGGRFKTYSKIEVGVTSEGKQTGQGFEIPADKVDEYTSLFRSKLFKFIFITLGGESGQSATGILQSLPNPGTNKTWTDDELYSAFNLSKEEIELVDKTVV